MSSFYVKEKNAYERVLSEKDLIRNEKKANLQRRRTCNILKRNRDL